MMKLRKGVASLVTIVMVLSGSAALVGDMQQVKAQSDVSEIEDEEREALVELLENPDESSEKGSTTEKAYEELAESGFLSNRNIKQDSVVADSKWSDNGLQYKTYEDYIEVTGYDEDYGEIVEIPDTIDGKPVTRIGSYAFLGCTNLSIVIIPSKLESIGESAFGMCESLSTILLPESITSIEKGAFWGCYSLQTVTIPESITVLQEKVFYKCESLNSVKIPNSVTEIGEAVFYKCQSLKTIRLPERLTGISERAFAGCTNLESVQIPDSVTSIGNFAFHNCTGLKFVTVPKNTTSIGERVFSYCKNLENIVIPEGIRQVGAYMFYECDSLRNVTLPESIKEVEDYAFFSCNSLKNIILPDAVTRIGDYAFSHCDSLNNIILPKGMRQIGKKAFEFCSNLENIILSVGLETIGEYAFTECRNLVSVDFPATVKEIREGAFSNCMGLSRVSFSEGILKIGASAFLNCSSFKEIVIPKTVTEIGNGAFSWCENLENVSISKSVQSVGKRAFYECANLKKISVSKNLVNIGEQSFGYVYDSNSGTVVQVKGFQIICDKDTEAYQYATKNGFEVAEMSDQVLQIPAISKFRNIESGVEIIWTEIPEAEKYAVFRRQGEGKWKRLIITSETNYIDTSAVSGKMYTYTIRCVSEDEKSYTSSYDVEGNSVVYLSNSVISSLKNTASGIEFTWNEVRGAEGYYIYRKTKGERYQRIAQVENGAAVVYEDTMDIQDGMYYTYAILAYAEPYKGNYTAASTFYLEKLTIRLCENQEGAKIASEWNGNESVDGYQIAYRLGAEMKIITLESKDQRSYMFENLLQGETYKIYVRGYKSVKGKNYYSAWSDAKTITVEK